MKMENWNNKEVETARSKGGVIALANCFDNVVRTYQDKNVPCIGTSWDRVYEIGRDRRVHCLMVETDRGRHMNEDTDEI